MLRRIWAKIKAFFNIAVEVNYTSVLLWKPWRDFWRFLLTLSP